MKKIKILLFVTLAALALSACSTGADSKSVASKEETTERVSKKDKKDKESKKSKKETTAETEVETEVETEYETEVQRARDTTDIAEQLIYDSEGIKVTVTGFGEDSWSPYLNILIENDTDQAITVQVRDGSINNYMSYLSLSSDVSAGKKAKDKITFDTSSLELCGIKEIQDIEFSLNIIDAGYDTIAVSEPIKITRELSTDYVQEYDDSGKIVYDENGIKIVSKEMIFDDYGYASLMMYIENNTDQTITIQCRDTSVNGFMSEPSLSTTIAPGKKIVDDLSFYDSDLEELEITSADDIESIETSFRIIDPNSWDTLIQSESVSVMWK